MKDVAYRRSQVNYVLPALFVIAVLIGTETDPGLVPKLVPIMPLIIAVLAVFSTLTIEIAGGELSWSFTFGLLRKRVPIAAIGSVQAVKIFPLAPPIQPTLHGWLYSVSRAKAIAVALKDGRRYIIGCNEPDEVARLLSRRS